MVIVCLFDLFPAERQVDPHVEFVGDLHSNAIEVILVVDKNQVQGHIFVVEVVVTMSFFAYLGLGFRIVVQQLPLVEKV
jgi:hypothetical protein